MMQFPISLAEIKLTLLAAGVAYCHLDKSLIWAFGDPNIAIRDWVTTWNARHKDFFELNGQITIFDAIYRIGEAYVNQLPTANCQLP